MEDRFRDLPYPDEIKFSALGLVVAIFGPLGVIIGMFMNALVLLIFFKWEKSEVMNLLVHSKYPERWLKPPKDQLKADILRAQARHKGKWRFIMGYGVVAVGVAIFFISAVAPALSSDSPFNFGILVILACIWLSYGALFGWLFWITCIDNNRHRDKSQSSGASYLNYEAYRLGCAYYKEGEFIGAMAAFEEAIAYCPEDGPSWMALGDCLDKLNNPAKAEECYRNALAHISEEFKPNVMFNLANNLLDQFRFVEAIELYRTIPKQSVVYSKAQNNLSLAEFESANIPNLPKQ